MRYPSQELPFKDIIANETWQDDDVFTQQRLAGLNPMSLRKMTSEGKTARKWIAIARKWQLFHRGYNTINAYELRAL